MSEKCAYLVESGESKFCRLAEANIQKVVEKAQEWKERAEKAEADAAYWKRYAEDSDAAMIDALRQADSYVPVVRAAKAFQKRPSVATSQGLADACKRVSQKSSGISVRVVSGEKHTKPFKDLAARLEKAESVIEAAKTLIRYLQHAPEAIGVLQSDDTALDSLIEAVEAWEAEQTPLPIQERGEGTADN